MSKRIFSVLIVLLVAPVVTRSAPPAPRELVVYAYDSFVAKNGLGPALVPLFEKKCDCVVKLIGAGDAAQLVSRVQLDVERRKPVAHVLVGLDQNLWERARPWVAKWGRWKPKGYELIAKDAHFGNDGDGFLAFDYGVFALMADHRQLIRSGSQPPRSLKELLDPKWKRSLILEDPRTSSPGLAFLLFTRAQLGAEESTAYWSALKSQWLTLAPGWDEAYGLFLKKEAPLVWSYTTSQAYHAENGDTEGRYKAVLFEEGQPLQIEGAALVKDAPGGKPMLELSRMFLEFLISPEVQALVPRKNWMLPVLTQGLELPPSFEALPEPARVHRLSVSASELKTALAEWGRAVQ